MDLSVLLPVRNAAATVEVAVGSVLADLGGADAEVVLVDDGSTDGSGEVLRALAYGDGRLKIVDGSGRGIAAALNAGLAACSAPLIARMDADDLWVAGRTQAQLQALRDPALAAVGGRVEVFGDAPLTDGMRQYQAWLNGLQTADEIYRDRYVESPLVHPAAMLRRSALEAVGGWRDGDFPEDYALWLALLGRGFRLANVAELVLRWRDSAHRLTRTDPRYALAAHAALKAEHLAREPFAADGVRLAGAGPTGLRLSRLLRQRGVPIRGFVEVHPRKIGTVIEGAPVVGYDAVGAPDGIHLLVAVGSASARQEVRDFLAPRGWVETRDFTAVA